MKYFPVLIGLVILFFGGFYLLSATEKKAPVIPESNQSILKVPPEENQEKATIVAQNLDTPWSLVFLPDNSILVTERPGRVRLIENNSLVSAPVADIENVREIGEGGLLGIDIHPDFAQNNFVYLYYTYLGNGNDTLNRVVRMTYQNKKLTDEKIIVDKIPGASNHNGGRLKFGPDNYLYITTGDAEAPSRAQDKNSLAGKILRINDDGEPAPGNPFSNLIYSYGHRNSQGLAWDEEGVLWATEHGRSGIPGGLDEINKISSGNNYGWPVIQGDKKKNAMETPVVNSGVATWAPGGAAIKDNSIYFAGLRGSALYRYNLSAGSSVDELFKGQYGRIRDVVPGPDDMLYITTSNLDGRGNPKDNDDKIIRVNPALL